MRGDLVERYDEASAQAIRALLDLSAAIEWARSVDDESWADRMAHVAGEAEGLPALAAELRRLEEEGRGE